MKLIAGIVALTIALIGCAPQQELIEAKVIRVVHEKLLILDSGEAVVLAGVHIPTEDSGPNYHVEIGDEFQQLMLNRRISYRIISPRKEDYPVYDLIEVVEPDGSVLNETLLGQGKAFFDHGYYPGHARYRKIEEKARMNSKGLWGKYDLQVVLVGKQSWKRLHYPECPSVRDVDPEERMNYYFVPPEIYAYRYPDFDCQYCQELEKELHRPKLFYYSKEDLEEAWEETKREKAAIKEYFRYQTELKAGSNHEKRETDPGSGL